MTRFAPALVALLAAAAAVVPLGCHPPDKDLRPGRAEPAAWPADCPAPSRPEPLGAEAARLAHRRAERAHALRVREAREPGAFVSDLERALDHAAMARGELCLAVVADLGQLVFEHEFSYADGLGGGAREADGPFRRVHEGEFGGPETISCPSCHWIGGPAGAGAETDNAFLFGDGARPASADARNPPALVAVGVVEALAREMTRDLDRQRRELVSAATSEGEARQVSLRTKGVDFGVLAAGADGALDTGGVVGVDPDLVVKPFGWKGTLASFADFADEALQIHMGIQSEGLLERASEELIGTGADPDDPDGDGVRGELGRGVFAALAVHLALRELPIVEPLVQTRPLGAAATGLVAPTTTGFDEDFARGRRVFEEIGCAGCHLPKMVLDSAELEVAGLPAIDLAGNMEQPSLAYDRELGGYAVWLFSDLKRHDMGRANEARHEHAGVARRDYLTPRLWGVADSAPYLHDGRAPSLDYAIAGHGGEGAAARDAFAELEWDDKGALRVYLMSLRRSPRVVVP